MLIVSYPCDDLLIQENIRILSKSLNINHLSHEISRFSLSDRKINNACFINYTRNKDDNIHK